MRPKDNNSKDSTKQRERIRRKGAKEIYLEGERLVVDDLLTVHVLDQDPELLAAATRTNPSTNSLSFTQTVADRDTRG